MRIMPILREMIFYPSLVTLVLAQNEEWEFAGVYADEALSGTRADKRDDFQRMMSDCRAGKIDRILVKSISRFARNTIDSIESVRELRQLGIAVIFEEQQIDTGTMGSEMLLSMLSAAAQEESLSISKNLKWSYRRRMKSGDFITNSAPLGYFLQDNTLIPDPQEVPIVEYIFDSYLAGKSTREIANDLNGIKVNTASKIRFQWYATTINYVLHNEKYIGNSLVQKQFTLEEIPIKRKRNIGQFPQYYIENSHQGIISHQIFNAAQELSRKRNALHAPKNEMRHFPLSRIMKCGLCGSTFHRKSVNNYTRWICYAHLKNIELCPMDIVQEHDIYKAFLLVFNKLRDYRIHILEPMLSQLQELQSKTLYAKSDVTELHTKISELVKQNHALSRLQTKGCIDSAIFIERCNSNNQIIEELRSQLGKLQNPDIVSAMIENTILILNFLDNSPPLHEFELPAFNRLIEKISIYPEKTCFHLVNNLILEEARDIL